MASDNINYNEVLIQINTNLTNALNTFGPSSKQYQIILELLKECLRDIDKDKTRRTRHLDPDTLSVAMELLEIGK